MENLVRRRVACHGSLCPTVDLAAGLRRLKPSLL